MICTYSVIIQSQKTLDSFSQYQPLFADAVASGKIGVCKWIESGTTIDTALPELANLTDDKQEWRAVIVRHAGDDSTAAFGADPRNPYDFDINQDGTEQVEESPIPLVRLTQMLGGIPPLEVRFKTETVTERHKAPRMIYVPVQDEQREQAHKALARKYQFDGKRPVSILIVSVRDGSCQDEERLAHWTSQSESKSSEFWKRNHYPSVCRFTVYDFKAQGPIQREVDNFGFWYAVMLLSTNEWDPSTIQAYRLYALRMVMDLPAMTKSFQDLADRLRDAKRYIEHSIREDRENGSCEEEALPDYRVDVSVPVKSPDMEECLPKTRSFGLLSRGAESDIAAWAKQRKDAEETLEASVRSAGRALDQAADRMRDRYTVSDEDVFDPLNMYQEEDMQRELQELYSGIVEIQGKLPDEDVGDDEQIQESASSVRGYLLGRVPRWTALSTIVLTAVLLGLSAAPAVIFHILYGSGSVPAILAVVGAMALCALLAAAAVLLFQKLKLNRLIKKYVSLLKSAFNELTEQAGDYSTYMSRIGSHQRGSSYLNLSNQLKNRTDAEHNQKYRHIAAVNILLSRLRKWSKAHRLNVDYASPRPASLVDVSVDMTVAPIDNKMYAFNAQTLYPVAINSSGLVMDSPYPFASRIEIVREELYDDE